MQKNHLFSHTGQPDLPESYQPQPYCKAHNKYIFVKCLPEASSPSAIPKFLPKFKVSCFYPKWAQPQATLNRDPTPNLLLFKSRCLLFVRIL